MDMWDQVNQGVPGKKHLSSSTRTGLRVTIRATIRLFEFLNQKQGFKYLMTDRLNQDPLEVIHLKIFKNVLYMN